MQAWAYTLIPAAAAVLGATVAVNLRPGPVPVSAIQHFAAGVVFAAAAAGEILPDLKHAGSIWATLIGGGLGVAAMLGVRKLEKRVSGPVGLMSVTGIDILVDGLVLGIAFAAGAKAGFLLHRRPDHRGSVPWPDGGQRARRGQRLEVEGGRPDSSPRPAAAAWGVPRRARRLAATRCPRRLSRVWFDRAAISCD